MKLSQLSPDAYRAVRDKKLNGQWSPVEALRILTELAQLDQSAEFHKSFSNHVFVISLTGLILGGIVAGAILFDTLDWELVPYFGGGLALLAVVAYGGWRWNRYALAADLPNDLGRTLLPLLRTLGQDLHPGRKIAIRLNLHAMDEDRPDEVRNLSSSKKRSRKQQLYVEPLGSLSLTLANGNKAVLKIRTRYSSIQQIHLGRRRKKTKTKKKSKWSKCTRVTCFLIPRTPVVWDQPLLKVGPGIQEKILYAKRKGKQAAGIQRSWKWKTMDKLTAESVQPEEIVHLFLRLIVARRAPAPLKPN